MQLRDLDRMPLRSTAAVAAIMCCLASAPSTYAGNEGSATGRLVPGGWLQPATPPGPPPVAQTVRPDQASPPEPVLASGLMLDPDIRSGNYTIDTQKGSVYLIG